MSVAAAVLLLLTGLCSVTAWQHRLDRRARAAAVLAAALLLLGAALLAAASPPAPGPVLAGAPQLLLAGGWVLTVVTAAAGGGPVAELVLRLAGRHRPTTDAALAAAIARAGEVLRGGATIGLLERGGIALTLLAGFPEGVAVVVAVKALGRYPELRSPGVSERFIIGTLTSVLWAAATTGVGVALFGGGPLGSRP